MNVVRQTEPGLCLAACVAMVADTTIEEVCAKCRILKPEDGVRYLPENEAVKFLASRMLCYGLRISPGQKITDDVEGISVSVSLDAAPAILAVPSQNFPGYQHAVVWDNERRMILDPLLDEPQPIEKYEIIEWVPISHL